MSSLLYVQKVEPHAGISLGTRDVHAGYFMGDFFFSEKWRLIGGLRIEKTDVAVEGEGILPEINLVTAGSGLIQQTDLLPAVSVVYKLLDAMNLRFAFSQTSARPSFRELGPFFIRNFAGGDVYEGNPNLVMSEITNFDFRWEWFGSGRQFYSFSVFYKEIDNAIERFAFASLPGTTDPSKDPLRIGYSNNPNRATLLGLEAELRSGLGFLPFPLAEDFLVGMNFTYIDAAVGFRQDEIDAILSITGLSESEMPTERRLQDQPEWILNASLQYQNVGFGSNVTLAYYWISDELKSTAGINTLGAFSDSHNALDLIAFKTIRGTLEPEILS